MKAPKPLKRRSPKKRTFKKTAMSRPSKKSISSAAKRPLRGFEVPEVPVTPKPRVAPVSTLKPGFERLERYMAHSGLASRREAKDLIARGLVTVNKKVVREPGHGIRPEKDTVEIKGGALPEKETILLFKPRGIETNATSPGVTDIASRYPRIAHLSPIGRLDKDSTGLILLSNDGTLARALTQEDSHVEKEYLVTVREEVGDEQLRRMANGIMLDKEMTRPAIVERRGRSVFSIILKEGRKHQIRRMCDACRLTITTLTRIRIGHLKSGSMIAGNMKSVSPKDVQILKNS